MCEPFCVSFWSRSKACGPAKSKNRTPADFTVVEMSEAATVSAL